MCPRARITERPQTWRRTAGGACQVPRCGPQLTVRYTGIRHNIPRYSCWRGLLDNGEPRCIAFGGLRVDDAIEKRSCVSSNRGQSSPPPRPRRRRPIAATRSGMRSPRS